MKINNIYTIKLCLIVSLFLGRLRKVSSLLTLLTLSTFLAAQSPPHIQDAKRANSFGVGYASFMGSIRQGRTSINFVPFQISRQDSRVDFSETNAHISDTLGNLLFYTNGVMIADRTHNIMQGCDTLNPGLYASNQYTSGFGYRAPQGAIILPKPNQPNQYYVFHMRIHGSYVGEGVYYTEVDMNLNNGLGAVTSLRNPIYRGDSMCLRLNVCRHANGRDWWLIARRYTNDSYLKILIDPQGVHNLGWQTSPMPNSNYTLNYYTAKDAFSPDGSKFATITGFPFPIGHYVKILDFDRCTGTLSNPLYHYFTDTLYSAGIGFSPNSQYLYFNSGQTIYQIDMTHPAPLLNIQTVARYDGFTDQYGFATYFGIMYLGIDNKIYISTSYNITHYLHTITSPNNAGTACGIQQHSIHLRTPNGTLNTTYPPYFALGSLDGSPCDTLGIDNVATYNVVSLNVNLTVYPNPASDVINIAIKELSPSNELKATLYNLLGQPFKPVKITNLNTQIPIYDLPNGIYFFSISDSNSKPITKRIVVHQ